MPTPEQNSLALKRFVAGLLPDKIREDFGTEGDDHHYEWLIPERRLMRVLETEWLYIVSLAEKKLSEEEQLIYTLELHKNKEVFGGSSLTRHLMNDWFVLTSDFNKRATALARVKGVDIEL